MSDGVTMAEGEKAYRVYLVFMTGKLDSSTRLTQTLCKSYKEGCVLRYGQDLPEGQ